MTAAVPAPRPQRLSDTARDWLLRRYYEHRDPADLEKLVMSYRPLAWSLAHRYTAGSRDHDLEQAACEGLVKALQRFDPGRGAPFVSFAVPTILGEIRRYRRDMLWPVHVPRSVQERLQALRPLAEHFTAEHGRSPTVPELAARLECSEEEVVESLTAAMGRRTESLQAERSDLDGATVADTLGALDPAFDEVECAATVDRIFPALPFEEQAVIRLRFGGDLTQQQIATRLGYSRSHVGRLLGSAIEHLREAAAA